ncbi:unnamed protein product [Soboliphyme baturini]|uniref:Uncharacterized protein n=1 Tax=Soboliphyme baturini TaxID=241478 RepID=A0A183IHS4_9BILA|nr:unnamed protein product [Soboliphyme baturini]
MPVMVSNRQQENSSQDLRSFVYVHCESLSLTHVTGQFARLTSAKSANVRTPKPRTHASNPSWYAND